MSMLKLQLIFVADRRGCFPNAYPSDDPHVPMITRLCSVTIATTLVILSLSHCKIEEEVRSAKLVAVSDRLTVITACNAFMAHVTRSWYTLYKGGQMHSHRSPIQ